MGRTMPMWVAAVLVAVIGSVSGAMAEEGPQRFSVHGTVVTPPDVADRSAFLLGTRVVLDGGSYVGFLKADGAFEISDLPSASYILEVYSPDHVFPMLRLDLSKKFQGNVRVSKADVIQGKTTVRIPYGDQKGLVLNAMGLIQHYEQREQWSIKSIIFNPMLMMMAMPMIMMYVMPMMMEGMDKDQMAEMQKQQAAMQGGSGFDLAETLAGLTSAPTSGAVAAKKPAKIK